MFGRQYQNVCRVEVSEKNLVENFRYLSKLVPQMAIAPVLKSNAYGHGLVQTGKIFAKLNPPFLCVDSLYEAYELSKAGIRTPILVMGYVGAQNLSQKRLPYSFCAYDLETLVTIHKLQPVAGIHLFVDTGMHREGIAISELAGVSKLGIPIEGLMSHLGAAFEPDNRQTQEQVANFAKARQILADQGIFPKWVHLGASGAVLNAKKYGEIGNMARVGKALYLVVKPAMRVVVKIAQVKEIKKGDKVGYDFTFTAKRPTKLAVLPIGYNDGVDRRLSNKGVVLIGSRACPIVGRVSMNITTIDVSNVRGVKMGDEVIVFSENPKASNSIAKTAEICGTIPYEILVHIQPLTKRVVI
ncbi:alanine racemase [Candidatus Microgenomates bacterium]|nr:alanine racemase [Candidatus Microgenomates bacterium]